MRTCQRPKGIWRGAAQPRPQPRTPKPYLPFHSVQCDMANHQAPTFAICSPHCPHFHRLPKRPLHYQATVSFLPAIHFDISTFI
jgi:hypothetical protein